MTDGPRVAKIAMVEENGRWFVEARVAGELVRRLDADSESEAMRMFRDLIALAQECGGQLQ